ncbi:MAG: hypothetical protein ABIL58_05635 [Pseudomonadota bacterium]
MSDIVYIGRVKWMHENYEKNYRHATVEPLIRSSEDRKRWIGSIENPVDDFPARGFVNWHDAPKGLEMGDFRQFDLDHHPFYKGEPDKEAFQIRNSKYPTEIIDLRDIGSERDIRILLTTKGIFFNERPLVDRCVLWIHDKKWVGPVDLLRRVGTSSWVLAPSQRLDSIRCWNIPTASIQQIELEGTRYLLTPNQDNLGQHKGFVTWEADEVLARRVLNRLRKRDRKTADALKISKDVFKTYIDIVEKAGLVGSELHQELSFRERIQEILNVIAKNEELLDEAVNVCFDIGPVKQKMEEKAEAEYQKKLSEQEALLDIDLTTKKREIDDIEVDLRNKKSKLDSLQVLITTAEQKLAKHVSQFDKELSEKLREVAEKPERLFAEMAFIGAISSAIRPPISVLQRRALRAKQIIVPDVPIIREPSGLVGALSRRLLSIGVSPQVGQALHCALASGTVPVVTGPDALNVVRCYADCVSGGVLHWIPVGGTLLEPADLMGRVDPVSGSFFPHPSGLLDLLLDDSDAVHLVVLDGFNRAASDGYLLPLIQSLRDAAEGRDQLTIPLVPQGFFQYGDFYEAAHRVAVGRNILLVLRPTTGASVLPVARELWEHCAVINTELSAGVSESSEQASRVLKADWNVWFDQALSLSVPIEKLSEQPKASAPLPRIIRRKIERIYGAGALLELNPDRATDQALKVALLPYLVACNEPIDEWSRILGLELDELDRRVVDLVRRLKG